MGARNYCFTAPNSSAWSRTVYADRQPMDWANELEYHAIPIGTLWRGMDATLGRLLLLFQKIGLATAKRLRAEPRTSCGYTGGILCAMLAVTTAVRQQARAQQENRTAAAWA